MKLTVITNSLSVLNRLSGCEKIRLICCGGDFDPNRNAFLGSAANHTLEYYQTDIAFISPAAIDKEKGFFDKTEPIAELHRSVIRNAKHTALLMDHTLNSTRSHLSESAETFPISLIFSRMIR